MNRLSFNEIKEIIESQFFEGDFLAEEWLSGSINTTDSELVNALGLCELVCEVGGEGQGDTYYSVYYFADHDIYIQFDGWYTSHEGAEYEDMFPVQPREKVITVYDRI